MQTLNSNQYQQLMNMLSNHLTNAKLDTDARVNSGHISCTCLYIFHHPTINSKTCWMVDSSATSYICYNKSAFHMMKPIQNAYITLQNNERLPVHFICTVRINSNLVIEDVLCVPMFKFNLLSVSSITGKSSINVIFLTNSCIT